MKNLLAATLIMMTLYSCQKEEIKMNNETHGCDCFEPLGVFAEWEYETTRTFYDKGGRLLQGMDKKWNSTVQNVVGELSDRFEDGHLYYIRKSGSDENNLYNVNFLRFEDAKYFTPYKMFLMDVPVGTEWEVDLNKTRVATERIESMDIGNKKFNDVIVIEEIKFYRHGGEYILSKEYYAKNVGLIKSITYNYENFLISTDTKILLNHFSQYDI